MYPQLPEDCNQLHAGEDEILMVCKLHENHTTPHEFFVLSYLPE